MCSELASYREHLDDLLNDYNRCHTSYRAEKESFKIARNRLFDAMEARELIQDVAAAIQHQAHEQIAAVVTMGLQLVFEKDLSFKIHFDKKRGKTEARMVFLENDKEMDPMNASAGGVLDVAAFTLRIACLTLSKPSTRPLLILDEPFKNVSKEEGYLYKIPILIEQLTQDMNIQIVMVTHIDELKVGKIIHIT